MMPATLRSFLEGARSGLSPSSLRVHFVEAATESTGDVDAKGYLSGNAFIGAKVRNAANETVGSIEDIYLDAKGAVQAVVVSVGSFLGVGTTSRSSGRT
jgi:hypothetical protein